MDAILGDEDGKDYACAGIFSFAHCLSGQKSVD
jgi:hypothetical protein